MQAPESSADEGESQEQELFHELQKGLDHLALLSKGFQNMKGRKGKIDKASNLNQDIATIVVMQITSLPIVPSQTSPEENGRRRIHSRRKLATMMAKPCKNGKQAKTFIGKEYNSKEEEEE